MPNLIKKSWTVSSKHAYEEDLANIDRKVNWDQYKSKADYVLVSTHIKVNYKAIFIHT